jgi:hypothetical protein
MDGTAIIQPGRRGSGRVISKVIEYGLRLLGVRNGYVKTTQ